MTDIVNDTMKRLQDMASRYPEGVLVSYSGGKDSLAVMDMCVRTFKRVIGFWMYLVPGLSVEEEMLDQARKRWGVEILCYPAWYTIAALRTGIYSNNHISKDQLPKDYSLNDVYALARADAGLKLIAIGVKKSDNEFRRKNKNLFQRVDTFCPLEFWNKLDVLSYLAHHKIPIGNITDPKRQTGGIDLSGPSLCRLAETHPDDFKKLLEWFPYAESAVIRKKLFGIS